MKVKSLVLALAGLFANQAYAQPIAQLDFERSSEGIEINYGDITSIGQSNQYPISGNYSLQVNAQSHFEIQRTFAINQTFSQSTPFKVSYDIKLPELAHAQYAQNLYFYTSFLIEFDDGSQMVVYNSDGHIVPPQADSIHSFDFKTTLPKGKKITNVTAQWSTHLLEEMPVIFDNIEASLGENKGEASTAITHLTIDGSSDSAIQTELDRYFSGNPSVVNHHTDNGQYAIQVNADESGRHKLKFNKTSGLFMAHSTHNYLATYVTLHNPSNEPRTITFSGRTDFTKELSSAANTIANYNTLVLAPNERKLVPLMLDFSDDYYTALITSIAFDIEASGVILIENIDMYSAATEVEGAAYQVRNDYESGNVEFTTRYPDQVSISLNQDTPLYGEQSLEMAISPWRQASYSYFFPWSYDAYATQIHTMLDLNVTEAEYGEPLQICTDVYYRGGELESFCETRTLGKGSFQVDEIYPLDDNKQLYRFLVRVRSFSNTSATVNVDNFSLKYWNSIK
ncbi:hypothetical protein [Pseudoalteromonas luteoviolacea]|uniref:Uncharacterized protein n=1 Tax=Pseudoalteromonas luteoviolacea (strain 2ta16) TaxID=1353533 RepID=V4HDB6_PSEL2|nr:hypothetical protein [Pseudoalteromonas luteoviolacea]ESP95431.1 hypothetical protein PL2TA16_02174 [Pseudoalteromonas luteoviolacea 2ta16]KZN31172.1 hypothetical protein N483_04975 [Pseudoalteromonas luteoviolacea NCIMB 1944]